MKYIPLLLLATALLGHVSAGVLPGPQSGSPKPIPAGPVGDKVVPGTGSSGPHVLPGNGTAGLPDGGSGGENVLPIGGENGGKPLPTAPAEAGGGDFFRSATNFRLTNLVGRDEGNNRKATLQTGEPLHGSYAGNPGGKSLWWRHVATFNGTLVLSTRGSDFDTVLAVYIGDTLESLVPVGYDNNGGPDETSLVTVRVNAGMTYYIAVDGYNGEGGKVVLSATGLPLPAALTGSAINDQYEDRSEIAGAYAVDYSYNYNATADEEGYYLDGNSVWWQWVAPAAGAVTFHTEGSDFDTVMTVFRRNPPDEYYYDLFLIGPYSIFNDDAGRRIRWSIVTLEDVHAGEVFDIAIEGWAQFTGMIVFTINQQPTLVTTPTTGDTPTVPTTTTSLPTNEDFDNRLGIQGNSYSIDSTFEDYRRRPSNILYSSPPFLGLPEEGEPRHGNVNTDQSVWWTWTATASGVVTISVNAKPEEGRSPVNPVIGVYRGPRVSFLKTVTSAVDSDQNGSARATFEVTKGETYQIAVAAPRPAIIGSITSMTGAFTFRLNFDRAAPEVSRQPRDESVEVGDSVSFSVDLTTDTLKPVNYKWERRLGDGAWVAINDSTTYSGAKTDTLTVTNVTAAMDGMQFRCVITNRTGKVTSAAARLSVEQAPTKKKVKKNKKLLGGSSDGGGSKLLGN